MSTNSVVQKNRSKGKYSLLMLFLLAGTLLFVPSENVFAQNNHRSNIRHQPQHGHRVAHPIHQGRRVTQAAHHGRLVRHHRMTNRHFRTVNTRRHFNSGFHHRGHQRGFIFRSSPIRLRIHLSPHLHRRVIYYPERNYYLDEFNQPAYPVYLPNSDGTYTVVLIKRYGTGYVGPQGEHYTNFPTVEELKVKYGRQ